MDANDLFRKVHRIEIKTRRLSNNIFAGEYHSTFKGKGMSFSEVREYQFGDDVRDIDWNVTARFNKPYIKVFEEERELTVMLLIDVSASADFGTRVQTIKDLITEIAATLAFSAIQNNDKIGVLFFSDKIEKYIPPQKGKRHILYIIRELLSLKPQSRQTDITQAIEYLMKIQRRQCTVFIISDFIQRENLTSTLSIAYHRYDLNAIQVYDQQMLDLPNIGIIKVHDLESGYEMYVDTASVQARKMHKEHWKLMQQRLSDIFKKTNVRNVSVSTQEDYVKALINLFANTR